MSDKTGIEWTDATWNPLRGCSPVSQGCKNCYAMHVAHRFSSYPGGPYEGLTKATAHGPVWTGKIQLVPHLLEQPMRWRAPRRIFVNSMSDLFHEDVPDDFIDNVFGVMSLCPQHTFQVLTKRPERMLCYMNGKPGRPGFFRWAPIETFARKIWFKRTGKRIDGQVVNLPLRNVWLGVSVEDQATAAERIPLLLATPARVRWISAEPLLGPINLRNLHIGARSVLHKEWGIAEQHDHFDALHGAARARVDWVVAGGESGHGARPMHPDWGRALRDQCAAAGVPFLFKQWGEWAPPEAVSRDAWTPAHEYVGDEYMMRVGKRAAGRWLDGRTHDEYPK